MAEYSIKSGSSGIVADVKKEGNDNRLLTESISVPVAFAETELGKGYNINTGIINLTTANKSACLYVKNDEDNDVIINNIFYIIGNSTGGTGDLRISVLRNPSTGTIIDTTPVDVEVLQNRNFGSNEIIDVTAYKGAEGDTFTNGDIVIDTILSSAGQRVALSAGGVVLTKGSSFGVDVTPQASNTSMDLMIALETYVVTVDI